MALQETQQQPLRSGVMIDKHSGAPTSTKTTETSGQRCVLVRVEWTLGFVDRGIEACCSSLVYGDHLHHVRHVYCKPA